MLLYAYGESALTLCALSRNLDDILQSLKDNSRPNSCRIFYRPSFGRRSANGNPDFGRFDFILLSQRDLYLGGTKWDKRSQVIEDNVLQIAPDQVRRHEIFQFYLDHWAYGDYQDWDEFQAKAQPLIDKQLPGTNTRLTTNLQTVFGTIREHYAVRPAIHNVLLFFHHECNARKLPLQASDGFEIICIDCAGATLNNFITIEM